MSYEYQNHTKYTLGVKSKNCNGIFENKSTFVDFWEFWWKSRFLTIFSIFLHSFMSQKFLGNRQTQKNFQKWIQKFTEIILETSSVSISSKLVDIFGLKALCTKAWQKNRTLKRDFNQKNFGLFSCKRPFFSIRKRGS